MSLYLHKLSINAVAAAPSQYPKNIMQLHSLIYRLFGEIRQQRLLWSDESLSHGKSIGGIPGKKILILSDIVPNISPMDAKWLYVNTIKLPDVFLEHEFYAFKLKACCTKEKFHRKVAITDTTELKDWLKRNFERGGCSLCTCAVKSRRAVSFYHPPKNNDADGYRLTFNACSFEGVLQVRDYISFKKLFEQGIGRGKAFGLGLLQLMPLSE